MSQIQKIEQFRRELAVAETYEEIKALDAKASAIAEFARRNKVTKQKQDELGEFRIEIEAKKGAWLDEFFPKGGDMMSEKAKSRSSTLVDIGVTKDESANARLITKEADIVKQVVEDLKNDEKKVVTPYAVQLEIRKRKKQEDLKKKKDEYTKSSKKELSIPPTIKITDAVSFLNEFKDNSIDLLLTDPPYMTDVDDIGSFTSDWLHLAIEKVKLTGRAYICSGAYPREVQAFLSVLLNQSKFIVDCPLVWTYRNTLGVTPKMKYNLNYQLIWHLYSEKSQELDTSITNEMFSVQDINAPDGRQGNRLHKWQKPDELARRLIRHGSKENDVVVDPFACTGTFLIEASRQKRSAYGCDISIENAKIAEDRGCTIIGQKI